MAVCSSVLDAVLKLDPWVVFFSAVLQQLFAMIWFGLIVKTIADYYLAADKGVRRVEHIVHRYHPVFCSVTTLLAAMLRTVAVQVIVALCGGNDWSDYQQAAVVVTVLVSINQHQFFWAHRPLPLLLTEYGYEFAAALLAAVSCFGMPKFKN